MKRIQECVLKLKIWKDAGGQDLVEYALAAGLVAVAAVACMPGLSSAVNSIFSKIGTIVNTNVH